MASPRSAGLSQASFGAGSFFIHVHKSMRVDRGLLYELLHVVEGLGPWGCRGFEFKAAGLRAIGSYWSP